MDRFEDEFAVIGSELFEPVLVVSGAAKAVDRDAGEAGDPDGRRAAIRSMVRLIWVTPSEAQAPGSLTMRARSAVKSALTVRSPSDGGQSRMTRSWSTPSSAIARRSLAPIGSVSSCDSRIANAGVAATTDGGRTPSGSVGQPLAMRSPEIAPMRSSAKA